MYSFCQVALVGERHCFSRTQYSDPGPGVWVGVCRPGCQTPDPVYDKKFALPLPCLWHVFEHLIPDGQICCRHWYCFCGTQGWTAAGPAENVGGNISWLLQGTHVPCLWQHRVKNPYTLFMNLGQKPILYWVAHPCIGYIWESPLPRTLASEGWTAWFGVKCANHWVTHPLHLPLNLNVPYLTKNNK